MSAARAMACLAQLRSDRKDLYEALVDLLNDLDDMLAGMPAASLRRTVDKASLVVDQMEGRPM